MRKRGTFDGYLRALKGRELYPVLEYRFVFPVRGRLLFGIAALIRNVGCTRGLFEHRDQRVLDVRRRTCGIEEVRGGTRLKIVGDGIGFRRDERVDVDVFTAGE